MVSRFSRADFQVAVNSCNFRRHGMPKTTWLTCPSSRAPRLHEFLQDMEQCVSLKFGQVLVYQNPLVTRFSASRTVSQSPCQRFCCVLSRFKFAFFVAWMAWWHQILLTVLIELRHLKSTTMEKECMELPPEVQSRMSIFSWRADASE